MPQQILDAHQSRIGIEQLRRHGVSQLVTADSQTAQPRVMLHAFLDTANRYALTLTTALVYQEHTVDRNDMEIFI